MQKYGFDNFNFSIIDSTNDKEELDNLEKKYIKEYKALISENGYNIELGGNNAGKHSTETKRKIGEKQRGKLNHMYGKFGKESPSAKPVIDLTTGKQYEGVLEAARNLNLNFSHIASVARGIRGSTGNHVFRYIDKNGNIIIPEKYAKIKSKHVFENVLEQYKYLVS